MSKHMDGLNPAIIELVCALITKDHDNIGDAVKNLGNELKMDGALLEALTFIVMCSFNPMNKDKQQAFGQAQLAINQVFRLLAPDLPLVDKIEDICTFVLERNPAPIT